jgi:PAS domain S-box-containing protein
MLLAAFGLDRIIHLKVMAEMNNIEKNLSRLPPGHFLRLGIIFSLAFWLIDSLIDSLFFTGESYFESLQPSGMELYMRLVISFLFIAFGFVVSRYVGSNNRLSEYLEASGLDEQKRYRILHEFMPVAVIVLDARLRIVDWNREAEKMFGWNRSDVIGMRVYEIVLPTEIETRRRSIDDLFRGRGNLTGLCLSKNGHHVLLDWHCSPIANNAGKLTSVMLVGAAPGKTG